MNSHEEYAEAFLEIFKEAVRCRLRSSTPIGSSLSGGLDSSSIASTARDFLKGNPHKPLHTFSVIFPSLPESLLKKIDERYYMQKVIDQGNFIPHFVEADKMDPLKYMDLMLHQLDEAFIGPNLYLHCAMYEKARQNKVQVFLDGIDGDTVVSHGFAYLQDLFRLGRWIRLGKESRAISDRFDGRFSASRVAWHYAIRPQVPDAVFQARRILKREKRHYWPDSFYLNKDFVEDLGLLDRYESRLSRNAPFRNARGKHWLSITSPSFPIGLGEADIIARAFGIEPRYPFFDQRLIKFCLSLPSNQKLNNGWDRFVLRKAMGNILPKEVQWRKIKADLSSNFNRTLLSSNRELLEETVTDKNQILNEYLDMSAVQKAHERYVSEPERRGRDAINLMGIVVLRQFLLSIS